MKQKGTLLGDCKNCGRNTDIHKISKRCFDCSVKLTNLRKSPEYKEFEKRHSYQLASMEGFSFRAAQVGSRTAGIMTLRRSAK